MALDCLFENTTYIRYIVLNSSSSTSFLFNLVLYTTCRHYLLITLVFRE